MGSHISKSEITVPKVEIGAMKVCFEVFFQRTCQVNFTVSFSSLISRPLNRSFSNSGRILNLGYSRTYAALVNCKAHAL